MRNYDDFNLDIQKTKGIDWTDKNRSCWVCPSEAVACIETVECTNPPRCIEM